MLSDGQTRRYKIGDWRCCTSLSLWRFLARTMLVALNINIKIRRSIKNQLESTTHRKRFQTVSNVSHCSAHASTYIDPLPRTPMSSLIISIQRFNILVKESRSRNHYDVFSMSRSLKEHDISRVCSNSWHPGMRDRGQNFAHLPVMEIAKLLLEQLVF
jgi:hypothetical protein